MSAQRLRDAAKVLRERAEAATPGPWWDDACGIWSGTGLSDEVAVSAYAVEDMTRADAAYVTTMHPGVALALADWLDDDFMHQYGPTEHALTVADLILGDAS